MNPSKVRIWRFYEAVKSIGQRPIIKKGPNNEEAFNGIISLFIAATFLPGCIYLLPIGEQTGN